MELRSSMNEAEIKMNSQDLDAYLKKEKIKSLVPGIKSRFELSTVFKPDSEKKTRNIVEERTKLDFYNAQKANSQMSMLPQISGNTTKMGNYQTTIDQSDIRDYEHRVKPITITAPENLPLRNANHQSSAEVLPEYKSVLDFGTPSRHPTKLDNYKYANSLRKTNATTTPIVHFRKQVDDRKYEANPPAQNEDYNMYQAQPDSPLKK